MAKTKELKLPKYLKLAKGSMWFDTEGPNASGIELYNSKVSFKGREPIYDHEFIQMEAEEDYFPYKPVPKESVQPMDDDKKWYFDTTKVPKDKQANIITAMNFGILVACDPRKEEKAAKEYVKPEDKTPSRGDGDFAYDHGSIVYVGKNNHMYKKLNRTDEAEIIEFINKCPVTTQARYNLQDLLEMENKRYNRTNRSRHNVLKALREKLNTFPKGMNPVGPIVKNDGLKDGEVVGQ